MDIRSDDNAPQSVALQNILQAPITNDVIKDYAFPQVKPAVSSKLDINNAKSVLRFLLIMLLLIGALSTIIYEALLFSFPLFPFWKNDALPLLVFGIIDDSSNDSANTPLYPGRYPLFHTYDDPSIKNPSKPAEDQIIDSDNSELPDGYYPIKAADLSTKEKYGLEASNETAYDIDLLSYLEKDLPHPSLAEIQSKYGMDAPVVLIVHTHGTEAYAENDATFYSDKDNCRTDDITKNVVAVGAEMAEYFNNNGIPTIHCTEMFDKESYINAYSYAAAAIKEFTAIYPSITYVFDVHRDSLISADMTKLRPVTNITGTDTAQYMCVIGTDENAGTHKNWASNLTLACHLQKNLWDRSSSLTRRMSIRSASYNQRYTPGSLLLEIGSCGNTLSEALACGRVVAEELTTIIKSE